MTMWSCAGFCRTSEIRKFSIEAIHNGQRGLEHVLSLDYALVIHDLMLPDRKGLMCGATLALSFGSFDVQAPMHSFGQISTDSRLVVS
jgi:hypothetical protein